MATPVRRVTKPRRDAARPTTRPASLSAEFREEACRLVLASQEREVLAGPVEADVCVNGRTCEPMGDWEPVCAIDEPEASYTEYSRPLAEGWTVERQVLLAPLDRFCFVADCLLGPAAAEVEYRLRWPLAAKAKLLPGAATHEARLLLDQRRSLLVLPLACPEWRADRERCSLGLHESGTQLELRHARTARRLHAALFIDLDPARSKKPYTWRRLAIAEQSQPVPRDAAAGYRVQIGQEQWVFYRSLAAVGNRTVLGVNLCTDFLAARLTPEGVVTNLIEIE